MTKLNVNELAEVLGIPKSKARHLMRDGTIPSVQDGEKLFAPGDSVRAWIDQQPDEVAEELRRRLTEKELSTSAL